MSIVFEASAFFRIACLASLIKSSVWSTNHFLLMECLKYEIIGYFSSLFLETYVWSLVMLPGYSIVFYILQLKFDLSCQFFSSRNIYTPALWVVSLCGVMWHPSALLASIYFAKTFASIKFQRSFTKWLETYWEQIHIFLVYFVWGSFTLLKKKHNIWWMCSIGGKFWAY